MRLLRDRAGVAAVEFALVAPVLIIILVAVTDFGAALLCQTRIIRAVASGAEYATLAGQANKLTATAIASNAKVYAAGVSSAFLGTATTTATVNNGAASGSTCCPGTTWTCSATSGFTCADGSTPGTYLTITATYPFKAIFPADANLAGKSLTETVVARLQ
jgi:Flp pilus assembly protein TadG